MPLPRPQDQLKSYFDDLFYDEEAEQLADPQPDPEASLPLIEPETSADLSPLPEPPPAPNEAYLVVKPQQQLSDQEEVYQPQRDRLQSLLNSLTTTVAEESKEATVMGNRQLSEPVPEVESIALALEDTPLPSHWLDNGRPNWAQEPFQALLLDVHGIKLAAPLASLGHIHKISKDNIPLFGQADWLLGLQKTLMGNIKAVDTARFVMPELYNPSLAQQYRYMVVINGLKWGLTVNDIDQPVTLDPGHIRWRPRRSQRPWMAGALKDHMCVLLDIPVLGETLSAQDRNAQ
jgi:purine-binding chemotaxis protein CheW